MGPGVLPYWTLAFCLIVQAGAPSRVSGQNQFFSSLEEVLGREERPILLVFFSTDCSICWDDLLEMRLFLERHRLRVGIVGISQDDEKELENFRLKYSFFYPIVLDRSRRIFRAHRVDLVPFKVVLQGSRVIYRDDYYRDFFLRQEEAKRCLMSIGRG